MSASWCIFTYEWMKSTLDVWKLDVYAWLRDVMQSDCIMEAARAAVMSVAFDYTIWLFVYFSSKQLTHTSHCSTLLINNSSALALHFLALCKSNNWVHLVLQRKSRCHSRSISRDKAASPKSWNCYVLRQAVILQAGGTLASLSKFLRLWMTTRRRVGTFLMPCRWANMSMQPSKLLQAFQHSIWSIMSWLQNEWLNGSMSFISIFV